MSAHLYADVYSCFSVDIRFCPSQILRVTKKRADCLLISDIAPPTARNLRFGSCHSFVELTDLKRFFRYGKPNERKAACNGRLFFAEEDGLTVLHNQPMKTAGIEICVMSGGVLLAAMVRGNCVAVAVWRRLL